MSSLESNPLACPARLQALYDTGLLDTPPEAAFDRLVRLAVRLLQVPVSAISFVTERRQFFKSAHGLPEPWGALREIPVADSLCRQVVLSAEPLKVEDASGDAPVGGSRAAAELGVTAYLGFPLVTADGHVLGAFCAVDRRPRAWTDDEVDALRDLAELAMDEIDLRRELAQRRSTEERLAHIAEQARCLLWHAAVEERDGGLCWDTRLANPPAARGFFGIAEGEELSLFCPWIAWILPEDLPRIHATSEAALRSGAPGYWQEYRYRRGTGEVRWLEEDARIERLAPDRWRVVGVSLDVTDRKRAEAAAQESEARARQLLETAQEGILQIDPDLSILYANERVAELLGRGREELIDSSLLAHVHSEDHELIRQGKMRRRQGHKDSYEVRLRRADGAVRHAIVNASPVKDAEGSFIGALGMIADITERKQAEAALRLSEERLRRLLETVQVIPWEADSETLQFTYVGPQAERILGYPLADWTLPGFWLSHVHPEDRAWAPEYCRVASGRGEAHELEYRMLAADGREVWLRDVVAVVPGADGRVVLRGFMFDVTNTKAVEEEVRASEARFRAIFEEAAIGIAIVDSVGGVLQSNPALGRLLGYDPSDLDAMTCTDFTDPQDRGLGAEFFREVFSGDRHSYRIEKRFRRRDDRLLWTNLTVSRFHGMQEHARTAMVMFEDITERKRAEQRNVAFRELGQRLNETRTPDEAARVVLETADRLLGWDSCWLELVSAGNGETRAILLMDELDGNRLDVPVPHEGWTPTPLATRAMQEGAVLILRPRDAMPDCTDTPTFGDRSRLSASIMCVPILLHKQAVGALSIQSYAYDAYSEGDLQVLQALADCCAGALERTQAQAAREELQAQLLQSQKMEAIGRLAGGVAHDFNNMLAVINGYAELLAPMTEPYPQMDTAVRQIREAGQRAADLTRHLLAFGRKQLLRPQVLDLNLHVQGTERLLQRLIGEDIELVLQLDPALGRLEADPSQIDQILVNLVVNARDAMPRGGRLVISTQNATRPATPARAAHTSGRRRYVQLTVSDTGCGMSPDVEARIWEPFYTTKPVGEGTGLGLSTIYGIVSQSGGHIEVDTTPGEGSTFRVFLPRTNAAVTDEADDPVEASPTGPATILVAEDEEMLRGLIRKVLEASGYAVLEAGDGQTAVEIATSDPQAIDLLITDVVMPGGISGAMVAERVRELRPATKILFISGYTDDAVVRHGVEQERAPFLQKPFGPTALVRKVRELLHPSAGG